MGQIPRCTERISSFKSKTSWQTTGSETYVVCPMCNQWSFVQVNLMCSGTRTKIIIVGQALVVLPVACALSYEEHLNRHYITDVIVNGLYLAFYGVVPMTVLIINVLLVREVRRASINAAASLGLHHQSTSSNSAVPTVMVVATSLVYVFVRVTTVIMWLAYLGTESCGSCFTAT